MCIKCQTFPDLETREKLQKIWEGISDCQLKTFCLTVDGDFQTRTAESKHRLPQLF